MHPRLALVSLGLLSWQPLLSAPAQERPAAGDDRAGLADRVVVLESPELARQGLVEGILRFAGGSAHEPADGRGATELLRRVLVAPDGALATVPGVPGTLVVLTAGPTRFELRFRCPDDTLDQVLDVLALHLREPQYDGEDLGAARTALEAELRRALDAQAAQPSAGAARAILKHVLGSESAWVPQLWPPDRPDVDLEAVRAQHARLLVGANLSVAVAGSAALGDVQQRVLDALADLPAGEPLPPGPAPRAADRARARVLILDRPGAARVELRVAKGLHTGADAAVLELWFASLSQRGSDDAPLRAARRVVQGLRFDPVPADALPAPAAWVGGGATSLEDARLGVELLLGVLSSVAERELLGEALANARRMQASRREAGARTTLSRALDALDSPGGAGEPGDAEVAATVQAFLEEREPWIVAVGPADRLEEALAEFGDCEVVRRLDGPGEAQAAGAVRARLLEAMGGRERLARLAGVSLVGEALQEGLTTPTRVRILRDLEGGRLLLDSRNGELASTIVLRPDRGWMRTRERLVQLSGDQHALFLLREQRQLFAVLRALAVDEDLRVDLDDAGRLLVGPPDELLCWIELDEDGAPLRLGYDESTGARTYRYGDWRETGGLRWPAKVRGLENGSLFEWLEFDPDTAIDAAVFEYGD